MYPHTYFYSDLHVHEDIPGPSSDNQLHRKYRGGGMYVIAIKPHNFDVSNSRYVKFQIHNNN